MASLGDRIAELVNPAPKRSGQDDEDFGTGACVDKYEVDYIDIGLLGRSQLRIQNFQPCLDKRYIGKKVSRKKLMNASYESDNASENLENDEDEVASKENDSLCSETSEQCIDEDDDSSCETTGVDEAVERHSLADKSSSSSNESENDDDKEDSDMDDKDEDSMIEKFSSIDMDEEVKKGKAVKAQLTLWDRFLETRIKLQKLLVISNKLPQNDDWKQFFERGSGDLRELVNKGHKSIKLLLQLLSELQTELLGRNNNTNFIIYNKENSMKQSSDEEIHSDTEDEDQNLESKERRVQHGVKRKLAVEEYPEFLAKRHKSFTSFRNGTIQKWNDKIKIASGKLSQNSFSAFDQSALKQIEQILNDKPRLIKRTQLRRSIYRVLGKIEEGKSLEFSDTGKEVLPMQSNSIKDYDPEIFDDDDFYHQLLRELIEKKMMTDTNNPIALSRQWLEIQKLRTKMKKNIDTKASKGRKVRYDVMPKLVNFMASVDRHTASDETVNELCHSLFKDGHQEILYT